MLADEGSLVGYAEQERCALLALQIASLVVMRIGSVSADVEVGTPHTRASPSPYTPVGILQVTSFFLCRREDSERTLPSLAVCLVRLMCTPSIAIRAAAARALHLLYGACPCATAKGALCATSPTPYVDSPHIAPLPSLPPSPPYLDHFSSSASPPLRVGSIDSAPRPAVVDQTGRAIVHCTLRDVLCAKVATGAGLASMPIGVTEILAFLIDRCVDAPRRSRASCAHRLTVIRPRVAITQSGCVQLLRDCPGLAWRALLPLFRHPLAGTYTTPLLRVILYVRMPPCT